jgi:glycine/D-amino acid oxidase-like deaminating enzyme
VFTTDEAGYSPEVFSRVGGEIWLGGLNSATTPLPDLPTESTIDSESIRVLGNTAQRLMANGTGEGGGGLEVVRQGLCFRPVTSSARPILCQLKGEEMREEGMTGDPDGTGVWVATGHGPWGISLSLGTGKVLGEMIEGRKTSADVSGLGL